MNILLVLIPVTLLVIVIAVALFFWAVNHQQFDDLESPAVLPLMDDPASDPVASSHPDLEQTGPEEIPREQSRRRIHGPRDPHQG